MEILVILWETSEIHRVIDLQFGQLLVFLMLLFLLPMLPNVLSTSALVILLGDDPSNSLNRSADFI